MAINYDKLFALMKEKGLTTYRIRKENIIPQGTLQHLRHGTPVSTATIDTLCRVLGCQPGDLLEYTEDKE